MELLWEAKLDCDEAAPVKIPVKWKLFCDHLHRIHSLRIPRWIGVSLECHIQLHGFSVAAEKEYYGTVFIRIQKDESCSCHLLIAKTRAAPLKHTLTIPKLEFYLAVLLSNNENKLKTLSIPFLFIMRCTCMQIHHVCSDGFKNYVCGKPCNQIT